MESPAPLSARSTSMSSTISTSSTSSDLSETARHILNSLCNDRDFSNTSPVISSISPDVVVQHDDNDPSTSRDEFFKGWQSALQRLPNFHMDIKETCVDETQMKVWVRSEITGLPGGIRKESIDMMQFNAEGVLTSSCDCQRVMKKRREDDDADDY